MITIEATCHICKQHKTCYIVLPFLCCEQCAYRLDTMSDEEFKKTLITELRHYPSMKRLNEIMEMLGLEK